MYLGSTTQTQSLDLSITTMIYWFKVKDGEGYLKNIIQHNLNLTRTTFSQG